MAFQGLAEQEQLQQLQAVSSTEPTSDVEPGDVLSPQPLRFRRVRLAALACGLLALAVGFAWLRSARTCSKALGASWAEEKVELDGEGQMRAVAWKLNAVSSTSAAQRMVEKAKKVAREAAHQRDAEGGQFAATPRLLPNSFVQPPEKGQAQGTAQCIFNVMEAMTATIGLGNEINGMVRVCPSPRDSASELACQVDSGVMIAFVGTVAAKLSLAASNCAETANIDAVCAAGVTGVIAALGELSAAASLAAPTCSAHPPALPTTKISELGDQTLGGHAPGRRLLIGQGAVGNGVQCGVDVSIVAENLANLGLAINQAAHSTNCQKKNWRGKAGSLVRSLCTIDIGGAIAYFSQVVTFTQIAILNCKDFLDIKALCGASIAGIATAAAAIAPYGAAIHAGCTLNAQAKGATAPTTAAPTTAAPAARKKGAWPVAAHNGKHAANPRSRPHGHRRLDDHAPLARMNEVMETLRATMAELGHNASSIPSIRDQNTASEADLRKLVNLMEPAVTESATLRGAGPFEQACP